MLIGEVEREFNHLVTDPETSISLAFWGDKDLLRKSIKFHWKSSDGFEWEGDLSALEEYLGFRELEYSLTEVVAMHLLRTRIRDIKYNQSKIAHVLKTVKDSKIAFHLRMESALVFLLEHIEEQQFPWRKDVKKSDSH